jgi:predicted phage baseplate assembly protein
MKGPISAAANAKITIEDVPGGTTEVRIPVNNRVFSITSPEDGAIVTYTLYKVNPDGSVLLNDSTFDLEFTVTESGGSVVITDAIILEGSLVIESGQFLSQDLVKSVSLSNYPYVEKSAQVIIEGSETTQGVYTEEDNLYAASSGSDKIFQVITDDNYVPTILFGDSALGQAPATGDTYSISYRVGGGTRGNLAKEVINVPITVFVGEQDYTGTLENSGEATGGADAETVDHAKRYAPLTFRRQDRIVTLDDYKTFANTFASTYGSTGKANAIVRRAYSSANIIDIFVLEKASDTQLRRATTEYKRQLLEAMQQKKMLTDEPVVVDGLIRTLELGVTISLERKYRNYEEEIKAQVSNKILEYFNVDNADFGQSFDPSDLIRFILELQKVRFAEINNIDSIIKINFNEIIQLNNFSITVTYI